RAAGDALQAARVAGTDPQRGVVQELLAAAARELERRIERAAHGIERVAQRADVRDAHGERSGIERGAAVLDIEHRGGGRRERDADPDREPEPEYRERADVHRMTTKRPPALSVGPLLSTSSTAVAGMAVRARPAGDSEREGDRRAGGQYASSGHLGDAGR